MRSFTLGLILILWMIFTVILALSFIGIVVFIMDDAYGNSHWFLMKDKILDII